MRYVLPLVPGLAVAAGVLSADLLARPRWRRAAMVCTTIVIALTAGRVLLWYVGDILSRGVHP